MKTKLTCSIADCYIGLIVCSHNRQEGTGHLRSGAGEEAARMRLSQLFQEFGRFSIRTSLGEVYGNGAEQLEDRQQKDCQHFDEK